MCIDVPDTEVDSEVNNVAKLSIVTDNDDISFKNGIFLNYDNDSGSILPSLEEVDDSSTDNSFSAGNANTFPNHECLNWSLRNPGTTTMGQRSLCPVVNAQLLSVLQIYLEQSKAGDSCEYYLTPA